MSIFLFFFWKRKESTFSTVDSVSSPDFPMAAPQAPTAVQRHPCKNFICPIVLSLLVVLQQFPQRQNIMIHHSAIQNPHIAHPEQPRTTIDAHYFQLTIQRPQTDWKPLRPQSAHSLLSCAPLLFIAPARGSTHSHKKK
jgi:hypothetical protein